MDKFEGQEAPISIYSTATSRAKYLAILVSSPHIVEAECHTPRQMQLANAFCRYVELAQKINVLW